MKNIDNRIKMLRKNIISGELDLNYLIKILLKSNAFDIIGKGQNISLEEMAGNVSYVWTDSNRTIGGDRRNKIIKVCKKLGYDLLPDTVINRDNQNLEKLSRDDYLKIDECISDSYSEEYRSLVDKSYYDLFRQITNFAEKSSGNKIRKRTLKI